MGLTFSYPLASYVSLENSISLETNELSKTPLRSTSFKSRTIFQSEDTGNTGIEGGFNLQNTENKVLFEDLSDKENGLEMSNQNARPDSTDVGGEKVPVFYPRNPKHGAALKIHEVYKSFRTRRNLADCAVLIEQSWWKLIDFAELKRSSISFFEIEKHETAVSRWSRARTRAAKVGKGLSKNSRAQKLTLQHWLEAIDPRHRYGHNLHFYYLDWLNSQSKEPFFYWLDIGEGKEVNIFDRCPRSKLHQQCIKYLGPMERKAYEVIVEDGKFIYKQFGNLLDTTGGPKDVKWIFVLSASMKLYVGQKKKGTFQHSSFLAGGATSAAGRIVVENGMLKAVWPHSGHYQPTPENFEEFITFLRDNAVDLTDAKLDPDQEEEEEESSSKSSRKMSLEELLEKDSLAREESEPEVKTPKTSIKSSRKMSLEDELSKKDCLAREESDSEVETPKKKTSSDTMKKLTHHRNYLVKQLHLTVLEVKWLIFRYPVEMVWSKK